MQDIQQRYQQLVSVVEKKKSEYLEAKARKGALEERLQQLTQELVALGVPSVDELETEIQRLTKEIETGLEGCKASLEALERSEIVDTQPKTQIIEDLDDLLSSDRVQD